MLGNLGGWHLLVILAIVLLLFGAAKLPALARSVGQSTRIFKSEMTTAKDDDAAPADMVDAEVVVPRTPPKV
ncbi:MAG: Sec-independent protein translocase subunit [Naasia sp.]|jgi:sec-independent protein translocase protein TatA|uniref:twin-arginine translocase TatA/TatE family subunit n=1 Tax=Naasia sp. TaxID=2546198 RepID=UPI00260D9989|nr:twin-arginine translocase TatA/TatE family subunit [Naasia sp.]MCU1571477.1 Sec-independent protein translocase subunit [Naasia sp.]